MAKDNRIAAIVRSTVDLAHTLGLTLVAEGVEDQESLALLAAANCDTAQGYHLSRPLPPNSSPPGSTTASTTPSPSPATTADC